MKTALARHILVKTLDQAVSLKVQIAKGKDFAQLAKKYSICPSGKKGGDLGEVRKGQIVSAIDKIIFKGKENVIHGPIKTKFGFHLVEVIFRD
ncbi:MAG: peptidylprolyl isomerase [Kangiellaceae bacterium]|jgi:peptidyl-prolyl cis-trans isomerase C|nr:peptidylprolyl isomerase [Kangiellaceae bacterium]